MRFAGGVPAGGLSIDFARSRVVRTIGLGPFAMPVDRQPAGACPKCQGQSVTCRYNHFEREALVIDSWEHQCGNCGFRQTKAVRSDDADAGSADPTVCPYCQRRPASD
jgi:hypothetical protein